MASRFVTCSKCSRSILLSKLNRHWAQARGYADINNPYPLRHMLENVTEELQQQEQTDARQQNEEGASDQQSDNDLIFQNDQNTVPPVPFEDRLLLLGDSQEDILPADIQEDLDIANNIEYFGRNAGTLCSVYDTLIKGQPSMNGHHYMHPCQKERDEFQRQKQNNKYYPYDNSAQFYLAETFARPDIQSKDRIVRGCVLGKGRFLCDEAAFSSYNHFMSCLAPLETHKLRGFSER